MTSPDRLKVLGSTLEALGSRQCSPATAALLHRSRINTELSPKTAGPYKGFGRRNQGPTGTKCRCNSPRQIEGTRQYIRRHLAADTEVTPPDRLKVLGSTLEALGSRQCSPATVTLLHRSRTRKSSVQKQQAPTKDLADEIRALLKQKYRSDFPRQIEGTLTVHWKHLAAKQCSLATVTLLHKSRSRKSSVQKTANPYKVTSPGRLKVL